MKLDVHIFSDCLAYKYRLLNKNNEVEASWYIHFTLGGSIEKMYIEIRAIENMKNDIKSLGYNFGTLMDEYKRR